MSKGIIIHHKDYVVATIVFIVALLTYYFYIQWPQGLDMLELFQKLFQYFAVTPTIFVMAAGPGADNGGWSDNVTFDVHATNVTMSIDGVEVGTGHFNDNGGFDCSNGLEMGGGPGTPSTPFLRVWNGSAFEIENDFLFGKPNTVFSTRSEGEVAYKVGIGGDTYVLQTVPKAEHGHIKLQIREIEPEESFIDSFTLSSVDLKPTEHLVADGNLRELHVFDTEETKTISDSDVFLHRVGTTTQEKIALGYSAFGEGGGDSVTLNTGDELLVQVPKTALAEADGQYFILLDSHFRDWTLSNKVPFSHLEMFSIQTRALASSSFAMAAGIALATGGLLGLVHRDNPVVPYTYADTPHTCEGVMCPCTGFINCNSKSLVVSVIASGSETYLETIFPRYARAAQEVVRIPREIVESLTDTFFTIRIRATKKHKVRAAFVFAGSPVEKPLVPLTISSAAHRRTAEDVTEKLSVANGSFVHTIPGDVVDLVLKDTTDGAPGTVRRYVLQTHGFYTRLSDSVQKRIGKSWYAKLAADDRKILRSFRVHLDNPS